MTFVSTHKAEIYYETYGEGPAVIFVHGVGGNSLSWWQQAPVFAQRFQAVVMDQRGFGRSSDPEQLGRAEFVNDLAAVIEALGLDQCALVGQSLGGIACCGYTARYPGKVRALVLADTLLGVLSPPQVEADLNQRRSTYMQAPNMERAMTPETVRTRPDLVHLFQRITAMNTVNRHTLKGVFEKVPASTLDETGVPILFVVGSHDPLYPPQCIKPVHKLVSKSEYVEIRDAGHSAYFEQPEPFNAAVLSFVAQHMGE